MKKDTFISDLRTVLFSPKRFFETRFMDLSSKRIFALGFFAMTVGLLFGSLITWNLSILMESNVQANPSAYTEVFKSLQVSAANFSEILKIQKAYILLVAFLSPLISYMAPHLFGGALFGLLWLLTKPQNLEISFARVFECAAISLTGLFWYIVPAVGPLVAMVMVMLNISRSLAKVYKLYGFMKAMGILSAVYLCFFLGSATLQLLALPLSQMLWP